MSLKHDMCVAFKRAKARLVYAVLCSFAVLAISASHLFGLAKFDALSVAVAVLCLQAASFYLRNVSLPKCYALGERIRRLFMLKDGRGQMPADHDMAKILIEVGDSSSAQVVDAYYESSLEPGARRLVEHIRESSFFTYNLAGTAASAFFWFTGISVFVLVLGFILSLRWIAHSDLVIVSRSFVLGLNFWVTGDLLSLGIRFLRVSSSVEKIFSSASAVLGKGEVQDYDALLLFNEYNSALASAPPIPTCIYNCCQKSLNFAWAGRNKN